MKDKKIQKNSEIIEDLVSYYKNNIEILNTFMTQQLKPILCDNSELNKIVHSIKYRLKDPEHLKNKLLRKFCTAKDNRKEFEISRSNLFLKINDLIGFRIIHLYTKQIDEINKLLTKILTEYSLEIIEGPIAKTWDLESKSYFTEIGMQVEDSPSLYSSVHYVAISSREKEKLNITFEIQVRTLAEELWGEVDHKLNYPIPSVNIHCSEQIKALARFTSGCSRLVDSIFHSYLNP
jgi:ppGpp synthetase/RelA/SpoT-type nucleotidyltranferase